METPTLDQITNSEEARDALLANAAEKRALSDPLPGPLADAFLKPEITVAGITVRPVVASTWVFLKAINSPLISAIADVASEGKIDTEIDETQSWEVCWIFTHTPDECRRALSDGPKLFRELVIREIGDSVPAYPHALVWAACQAQIKRHMETAIPQIADAMEDRDVRFFLVSQEKAASHPVGS